MENDEERGLGIKDALVAIEYASNRAKAEKELQDITTKVSDMKNQAFTGKRDICLKVTNVKAIGFYAALLSQKLHQKGLLLRMIIQRRRSQAQITIVPQIMTQATKINLVKLQALLSMSRRAL